MKSTMLLAAGLFLISAPSPDANDIAEMTANFIVIEQADGALSADVAEKFKSRKDYPVVSDVMANSGALPGPVPPGDLPASPAG